MRLGESRSTRRIVGLAALVALLAVAATPTAVVADHSIPYPLYFWDPNDNGVPGPDPDFDPEGSFWSSSHLNRLNEAVAEWSNDTDYDPGVANTSHNIYVDGTEPPEACMPGTWAQAGVAAIVCKTVQIRYNAAYDPYYYRISDQDIYFYMEIAGAPDWWVGSGVGPDANRYDFGGILTHELGHTVRLVDLSGSPCVLGSSSWFTMCVGIGNGSVQARYVTNWLRSLHADDKEGANYVYPAS